MSNRKTGLIIAGGCAGAVSGLFGGGGGMVLIPLLTMLTDLDDREVFSVSLTVILPICLVSLAATTIAGTIPWGASRPYLIGSAIGGCAAAKFGHLIPDTWLHRILGILILWGGVRYLC